MPKRQFIWNCSYSDFSCAISGFTSNDRAPGGPVTFTVVFKTSRSAEQRDCWWNRKQCRSHMICMNKFIFLYLIEKIQKNLKRDMSTVLFEINTYTTIGFKICGNEKIESFSIPVFHDKLLDLSVNMMIVKPLYMNLYWKLWFSC